MLAMYPAILHEEDGSCWIEFPDLPGCQTYGDTAAETMLYAEEALGAYLASRMDDGKEIKKASSLEDIECTDGTKTYVCTDVGKYRRDTKAVKRMVSLPAWMAKEADKREYSLSKITQEALLKKIDIA